MSTQTAARTLDELLAAQSPLEARIYAAVDHLCMVLGSGSMYPAPRAIVEQRREIEQAIAELQAAQAELDPPADCEA